MMVSEIKVLVVMSEIHGTLTFNEIRNSYERMFEFRLGAETLRQRLDMLQKMDFVKRSRQSGSDSQVYLLTDPGRKLAQSRRDQILR